MQQQASSSLLTNKTLWVLMLGTFAMGNAKFSIMPLVPVIAQDFHTTEDAILQTILAYFWGGLIAAPLIAIVCRHWAKHQILVMLSLWCFAGNLLSSFATNVDTLYWMRWFSGIPHAAFLAFACLLAGEMAPPQHRGRYMGWALLGLALATMVAVPFNAWIGNSYGWQIAFRFVALTDLLIVLLVHDLIPTTQQAPRTPLATQLRQLRQPAIWLLFGTGLCLITGMTVIWSFSLTLLTQTAHLPEYLSTVLLVVLGLGFVASQFIGGYLADRHANTAIIVCVLWALVAAALLWVFLLDYRLALLGAFFISIISMINVVVQTRLLHMPHMPLYLVFCLYNACIQLGNFIGSLIAYSISLSTWPMSSVIIISLLCSTLAGLLWWAMHQQQNRLTIPTA